MVHPVRSAARSSNSSAASLLAESVIIVDLHFQASPQESIVGPQVSLAELPRYDPLRRELWFLGCLVKKLRHPSPNQECLLKAFDEERWTREIFDPLPPKGETLPSKRLSDTVDALNGHHETPGLLEFEARLGERVCWLPGADAVSTQATRRSGNCRAR